VRENPPDDLRVLHAGDDPDLPPAALATFDIDAEYSLEPLRPAHRPMPLGHGPLGGSGFSPAPPG
jgi:hypothetical protein